jgi:AAA+ ATPase superfamily predicted ATPase
VRLLLEWSSQAGGLYTVADQSAAEIQRRYFAETAIGSGARRVSEIAGRLGRPATSMARPLERLVAMDLVRREVPFGETEKKGRRSLYKIDDPFFRLWFRIVAPHRGLLAASPRPARLEVLRRLWSGLAAQAWEELGRWRLPFLPASTRLAEAGPWGPAARW